MKEALRASFKLFYSQKRAVYSTQHGTVTGSFLQITFSVNTYGAVLLPVLFYLIFLAAPTNLGAPFVIL